MSLSSVSLKRPVMATVMSIIIVIFGGIGYGFLGVREYPAIDPPIITVKTSYTGASAEVVESQITQPLEAAINGVAGIRSLTSSSSLGSSTITVEFNLGDDLETAANDVRDKAAQAARLLPQDIDAPPVVTKADANSSAILSMTVQSDTRSQLEVSDYAANVIQQRIQTIPGVSSVQIWGEKKYAMRLWIDPARLTANNLTAADVQTALNAQSVELPTGKLTGANTEFTVNALSRLSTPQEFNDMVMANQGGRLVRFSDVGRAELGAQVIESVLKKDGTPMIGLAIVPQPGANYIAITNAFYVRYAQLKKELPPDIHLDIALDNTTFIRNSVKEVGITVLIAFTLVILIIYLFFRDWRMALRPLFDIPVSLIGAFFIMYLMGFSVNILTLLAIVLATGLVVDDGIVVTEVIYKRMEQGMRPMEAAVKGSEEVFFAVVSTSITLAMVFLPIIFLAGFTGRLFREFAVVIAGAVLISAFVALTLTPVLNVKLSRKDLRNSAFYTRTEPFFVAMTNGYRRTLTAFMRHRGWSFGILAGSLLLIFGIGSFLQSELAPLEDRSFLIVSVTAPEGATFTYMDSYMDGLVQTILDSVPERAVTLSVTSPSFSGSGAVNSGFIRLGLVDPDKRTRTQAQIAHALQRQLSADPRGRAFVIQQQTISEGSAAASGQPVQFVVENTDFGKLREVVPKFLAEASKDPTLQGVDVNLKFNTPEVDVTIDRERARALGVEVVSIVQAMQSAYAGNNMGYFIKGGNQYEVIGQVVPEDRSAPDDIGKLLVRSNTGTLVRLVDLLEVKESSAPPQLYHYNRFEAATFSAGLAPGKTIGDGITAMNAVAKRTLDPSFSTALSGASRDFAEGGSSIVFAMGLALVLIYLVLAAQFESFRDPLVIMLTVPMAMGGAVLSLWMFNQTLNIFSEIGMIMLIGLVTKNAILIVEFANQQRQLHGLPMKEAAIEAATQRLRPILMTTIATVFGALPIALGLGEGSQSRIPMGVVVVGGLALALVLTLYAIPVMYTYITSRDRETPAAA